MKTMCNRCGAAGSVNDGIGVCERCGGRETAGGERSGLIDVRSLAGLLQDRSGGSAPASLRGGLSLAPVAAAPPIVAPAPAVPAARASQAPLYGLMGLMTAGMVSLAGYVLSMPAAAGPSIEVRHVAAPVLAEDPEEDAEVAPRPRRPAREERAVDVPVAPVAPVAGEPAPRKPTRRSASEPSKPTPDKPPPVAQNEPAKAPAKETGPDPGSVECLLKPETCAAKPKAEPVPADRPSPAATSGLPEKLELSDISDGTRAAKEAAGARCKAMAAGGEVVKIKLSISGPEGTVLSARPEDEAGNPKLAACVAGELTKASFKRVQKPQIGATVTVKF